MHQPDQINELIVKYLSGETSPEEEETLFAWMEENDANRKFFEEMARIWSLTGDPEEVPFEANIPEAWTKIEAATTQSSAKVKTPVKTFTLRKHIFRWSAAAIFLMVLAAGIWWMRQPATDVSVAISTGPNEQKEIMLPDSTRVWLNANSEVNYWSRFEKRELAFAGEALFEVSHDEARPFTINTDEVTITVLGTSFNLRAQKGEKSVEVAVLTGRVEVESVKSSGSATVLNAGDLGVYDNLSQQITVKTEPVQNYSAWKTRQLVFDDVQMREVLVILERYFNIVVDVSNQSILDCHFKASFDNPELQNVIEVVTQTFDLEVRNEGNSFSLIGAGCQPFK